MERFVIDKKVEDALRKSLVDKYIEINKQRNKEIFEEDHTGK